MDSAQPDLNSMSLEFVNPIERIGYPQASQRGIVQNLSSKVADRRATFRNPIAPRGCQTRDMVNDMWNGHQGFSRDLELRTVVALSEAIENPRCTLIREI